MRDVTRAAILRERPSPAMAQSARSTSCVASLCWNGALKVAPKQGPPPLRCSCAVTGPVIAARSGIASLVPLARNEIDARPATVPSFRRTLFAPLLDISGFAYEKPLAVDFQQGLLPHCSPPPATLLESAAPAS